LALCGTDYYNNCIFHRNIKSFIAQTGDPTNTGRGGESIWGVPFEDEIHEDMTVSFFFSIKFHLFFSTMLVDSSQWQAMDRLQTVLNSSSPMTSSRALMESTPSLESKLMLLGSYLLSSE
jgi:cyclophilin family peptidyl-prolyl cis-trans isomerase